MPNLIEVQKDSYQWFLDAGLKEVFEDSSPISDYSGHLSLEFVDFTLCEDDVKYTIEAVSYTHLDVYKRQVWYTVLANGSRSFFYA